MNHEALLARLDRQHHDSCATQGCRCGFHDRHDAAAAIRKTDASRSFWEDKFKKCDIECNQLAMKLATVRAFLQDDAVAISYQTLGQYREAALRALKDAPVR